jgi:hypothetical protein
MPHLASLPKVLLTFIVIILICCLPEDVGRDDANHVKLSPAFTWQQPDNDC